MWSISPHTYPNGVIQNKYVTTGIYHNLLQSLYLIDKAIKGQLRDIHQFQVGVVLHDGSLD